MPFWTSVVWCAARKCLRYRFFCSEWVWDVLWFVSRVFFAMHWSYNSLWRCLRCWNRFVVLPCFAAMTDWQVLQITWLCDVISPVSKVIPHHRWSCPELIFPVSAEYLSLYQVCSVLALNLGALHSDWFGGWGWERGKNRAMKRFRYWENLSWNSL